MGKRFDFEYIIIGGGTTGIATAKILAGAKQRVAIIERDRWGGNELNYRDIPYGACLNFSHFYARAQRSCKIGLSGELEYSWQALSKWRDSVILESGGDDTKALTKAGVTCIKGNARFIGPYDIVVNEKKKISAGKFLIATGSVLDTSNISGLDDVSYLTPATALRLAEPPEAVMVIGGGASGCEIAQYFAELGAKVVLAEAENRILPKEDVEVSKVLEQYFTKRLGMKVLTDTKVVGVKEDEESAMVIFMKNGKEKMVRVENIVLATGNVPNVKSLGLNDAGVSFDKSGVKVDKSLQTSAKNIFAAGDVIGGDSSAEKATYLGQIVANNMLGKSKSYVNYDGFIRVIDTFPQVASTGITEAEAIKKRRKYNKIVVPLSETQASVIENFSTGFVKIMSDSAGKVLGATIVAPNATEMIQELAMAVRHGLTIIQIASTPHITKSWSSAIRLAARKLVK